MPTLLVQAISEGKQMLLEVNRYQFPSGFTIARREERKGNKRNGNSSRVKTVDDTIELTADAAMAEINFRQNCHV